MFYKKINRSLFIFFLFILSLPLFSTTVAAKDYYVSVTGDNTATGSKQKPFRTIQMGIQHLKAGDSLYIYGGTYEEELTVPSKIHGSSGKRILISSVPGEKVLISGETKKAAKLLSLEGTSYITIQNLVFANAKGQDACGISVSPGTHHFTIQNNEIYNISCNTPVKRDYCANAIMLFGESAAKPIHHGTIKNNNLHDCVTGWAECLSVTGNVSNITITKNKVKNISNIGIDLSGNYGYCPDPALDFPRNCTVTYNEVTNCRSSYATSYGIYVDGGQHIKIQHNTVRLCSGGIEIGAEEKPSKEKYSTGHILVEDNLIEKNVENGITVGGYEKNLGWVIDVQIANNICNNNGIENAVLTLSKCKDITIENNIFNNTKKSTALVYGNMGKNYTQNIVFKNNTYKNENNYCEWMGKTYTDLKKWKKEMEQ